MIAWLLAACATGPADPRDALRAGFGEGREAVTAPERLLLAGRAAEACRGWKAKLVSGDEDEDWRGLLTAAARAPGCLSDADGDALAAWGAAPERAEAWRGARAEWAAARKDTAAAKALLVAPGFDGARLRVLLAAGEGAGVREAAEGALAEHPDDVLACRTAADASLREGDLLRAIEASECGGVKAPELARMRGDALDAARRFADAEAVYREAGATVHLAALLYQEAPTPARIAEARALLDGDPSPPAALHRAWIALLRGERPDVAGLDHSAPAALVRVVAGSKGDLQGLEGAAARVAGARLAAAKGDAPAVEEALSDALAEEPDLEPVHRARVALRRQLGGDVDAAVAAWRARDPDHVRLRGARGPRDVPWAAIAPWPPLDPAECWGRDEVGDAWRAAMERTSRPARLDALASLQAVHPELEEVAAQRHFVELGGEGLDAGAAPP